MNKQHPYTSFRSLHEKSMLDTEFKVGFDQLSTDPEFALMDAMIAAQTKGITQTEIAHKMGTSQSAISRALGGTINMSIDFLKRFAKATDMRLEISFKPLQNL